MNATRLITLLLLAISAQAASASTIWLKDSNGQVCKNSASTNAGGVIGLGSVDNAGSLTLTISNPANGTLTPNSGDCLKLPIGSAATPLVFSGSVAPQMQAIHMWKPGTKGAMECLYQGSNFVGLSGVLTSGQYRLTLGGGLLSDGCDLQTQTKITSDGLPSFRRIATIFSGGEAPQFNGAYYIFNANAVPEPGSLSLLLAGAAGLTLLGLQRRRLTKRAKA